MKAAVQGVYGTQSVLFYESVVGILQRDTDPYLKLIEIVTFGCQNKRRKKFLVTSIFYGALWCSADEEIGRHSSYVWQTVEKYLLHRLSAFIRCNIKFSRGMH